jgi:hypothetical protein
MAGITFWVPILAVLSIPQRTRFMVNSFLMGDENQKKVSYVEGLHLTASGEEIERG